MITPAVIAQALASNQEALRLLRDASDQAARMAIGNVLKCHRITPQLDARQEAFLLDEVYAYLCAGDGKFLRTWDPSKLTFDTYVHAIAEKHSRDWCMPSTIERALAGDRNAQDLLVEAFDRAARSSISAVLRRLGIYRELDPKAEMDDLLQGVFAKLWTNNGKRLRAWNHTVASFDTYIGAIAGNYARDRYRRHRKQLLPTGDDPPERPAQSDGPDELVEFEDLVRVVLHIMRKNLNTMHRKKMFQLIIEEGREVDEICELTGLTRDAVYQQRMSFKNSIKEILADL